MKIILKIITISLFIFSANFVFGQDNNSSEEEDDDDEITEENEYDKFRNDSLSNINDSIKYFIDSLVNNIDSRKNLSKKKIKITTELDTLIGEQITIIEKQTFKNQSKYSFTTNKLTENMSVKIIDLYLYDDTLIYGKIIYDLTNSNYIDRFYLKNFEWISLSTHSGRCRSICIECFEEKVNEFIEISKKLIQKKR